ncbi:FGGY-family carbohydrate kinase [Marispirochaeta aestuarii]|uniref:xylulokinase n=1 Tax=Marispirochaeta aestuarii TaxID=1963862 RepID=UPI0029C6E150|nr:FGGY-family carbohydrate kinase [Marispirochaeta aestuarii]
MNTESMQNMAQIIRSGKAILGMELGSTRIKASLISPEGAPLAGGSYGWENRFEKGVWTYDMDEVWRGIAGCYADLTEDVKKRYALELETFSAGGFSGMMHGYVALDKNGELLTPFRTWRNNITGKAAQELTKLFGFAIPQRWSIAHLYQAILNKEEHVKEIDYLTTLAGYVHWKLTGERVTGIGEGSGMFPIDPETLDYDKARIEKFDRLVAEKNYPWKLRDILPKVLMAGEKAGTLSRSGAELLDPSGRLKAGIPICPPEGDAGTGMVATNSVRPRTGNVSAGTSVFAMIVLEKPLREVHPEIDIVTTPDGKPVAMAHSNNCSSDFDAWMGILGQAASVMGMDASADSLYGKLMPLALQGDPDAGGLLAISYVSGEHITGFSEGRPLVVRRPESSFTLPNLLRSLLFTAFCALRTGLNILTEKEGVAVDEIRGHGGLFRTPEVGQRIMAAATGTPVSLPETAGEGGAWGMALLAAYMLKGRETSSLPDFLDSLIADSLGQAVKPDPEDVKGFNEFFRRYHKGLSIEREAVKALGEVET